MVSHQTTTKNNQNYCVAVVWMSHKAFGL